MKDHFEFLLNPLILKCFVPSTIVPPSSKRLHSQSFTAMYKNTFRFYRASCLHNLENPPKKKEYKITNPNIVTKENVLRDISVNGDVRTSQSPPLHKSNNNNNFETEKSAESKILNFRN